jgi:hypothetical protein
MDELKDLPLGRLYCDILTVVKPMVKSSHHINLDENTSIDYQLYTQNTFNDLVISYETKNRLTYPDRVSIYLYLKRNDNMININVYETDSNNNMFYKDTYLSKHAKLIHCFFNEIIKQYGLKNAYK